MPLETYLTVLPFIFMAGFVDSIAGGGGVISILGFMMAGIPMHNALATNKVQSSFGTTVAVINYARAKHIDYKVALIAFIGAFLASLVGSNLALLIPQEILAIMMIFISFVVIGLLFVKKDIKANPNHLILKTALIGLIIGFYDGLLGPGTGTFLSIGFLFIGLDLITSTGTAKIVNLGSNIAAMIVFILAGKVIWPLAIACIIVNMIANYLGSKLAIKHKDKIIKPIMLVVLGLLIIKFISIVL